MESVEELEERIREWLASGSNELKILVVGGVGVGKSTLTNAIIGEEVAKRERKGRKVDWQRQTGATSVTQNVEEKKCKINGITVSVFDTPGFSDINKDDEETVYEIRRKTKEVIDLVMICFDTRLRLKRTPLEAFRNLKTLLTKEAQWDRVLIVFTYANMLSEEEFKEKCKDMEETIRNYIIKPAFGGLSEEMAKKIPVVPAGYKDRDLPGIEDWLSNIWRIAFRHINSKQAFAKLIKHRLDMNIGGEAGLSIVHSLASTVYDYSSVVGEYFRYYLWSKKADEKKVREWLNLASGQLSIVIIGRMGVSKSNLFSGLIGQNIRKSFSGAAKVTDAVNLFQSTQNGVQIQVIDTPGFDDPSIDDKDTIKEVIKKTKKEVDMILVCLNAHHRVSRSDMSAFRNLKDYLIQKNEDWSRVLVVLTPANQLDPPELFAVDVDNYSKAIRSFLTEGELDSTTAQNLPIVPAGHQNPALPGIKDWLSNLWQTAFECIGGKQDFLRLVEHRIADPNVEIEPAEPCDRKVNIGGKGGETFETRILSTIGDKTSKIGKYFSIMYNSYATDSHFQDKSLKSTNPCRTGFDGYNSGTVPDNPRHLEDKEDSVNEEKKSVTKHEKEAEENGDEFIKGIEKTIADSGGKINRKLAHIMFIGPPGSGKSSLMERLLSKQGWKKHSPSTGVCDSVVIVHIDTASPSSFHSVTVIDTDTWEEIDCPSSFIGQLRQDKNPTSRQEILPTYQMQTQSEAQVVRSVDSTTTIISDTEQSSSSHYSSSNVTQPQTIRPIVIEPASDQPVNTHKPIIKKNIKSLIKKYGDKNLNYLKKTSSLYLRDTGGQVEFQEMLALLIYGPSIFIFVFRADLDFRSKFEVQYRKNANESLNIYTSSITTEEALLQSLASVYATDTSGEDLIKIHQPLVFIVATHVDKLGSEREAKLCSLNRHIDSIIKSNGFSHLVCYFDELKCQVVFEVDNTSESDESFRLFRSRINSLVNRYEDFSIEYPINYLFFCLELQEIERSILTLKEFTDLAAHHEITGEDVSYLLRFLHLRIGLIRHFDVDGIRHIIIREPQVLFNKTTDLIIRTFSSSNSLFPGQITEFEKKGILTFSAFESIMNNDDKISPKEFLQLLVHLRITVPFHVAGDQEKRYFIPCVLNHVHESTKQDLEMGIAPLCVKFKCNHCPKGVFGVLVTHLMRPEREDPNTTFTLLEDKIFKDQVSFEVKSLGVLSEMILKLLPSHLNISFYPYSQDGCDSLIGKVCDNVRQVMEASILKSLKDLHYKREKAGPEICFKCEHCSELHPVTKEDKHHKISCRTHLKFGRIPPNARCWYNEDDIECNMRSAPSQASSVEESYSNVADEDVGFDTGLTTPSLASTVERSSFNVVAGPSCEHQQQHRVSCDTGTLLKELLPLASEWQNIGTMLHIPDGELEDIKKSNSNQQKDCLREMIKVWLNMIDPEPTWERLVEAVNPINPSKAEEIRTTKIPK